jgi:surfeit locus 1 family protein
MSERVGRGLQSGAHRKSPRIPHGGPAFFFSRYWWWKTLLVLVGMAVCVRLAIWQMDRLEQRKARNAETRLALTAQPIDLNAEALPGDAPAMRYHQATARGRYDLAHQMALEPQNWGGVAGLHLLTPLILEGRDQAVLVDRGWIPFEDLAPENWARFDEVGSVAVAGALQTPQKLPAGAVVSPQTNWYRVDLEAMQAQLPYELLPLYLVKTPDAEGNRNLPYRQEVEVDLSEGPHFYFIVQWLLFALILGGGYVWFVYNNKEFKAGS